ncbi:cyclin domain-containing protein [Phlyctema vagabunda]|uniref:Cyclin domain-containing protein n=1 Tax=Phlyctema vagabunda TaxID=108571 RepID=A0ABR4P456_9HELO
MAHHRSQPCDTYFVENETSYAREDRPDYARMIAQNKREIMANELSRQASEAYLEDIVQHMRHMEEETLPDVASIDIQQEIQWFMRPYLIDFLIEAHAAFQLLPETLFLAVNLLDRYCSRRVVYKKHYQLVGCAALLIAAKYGDKKEKVPMIRELKSMCCSLYEEEMFTQMEWHVLNTLDWTIGHPTVDSFLQIAFAEEFEELEVEHMAWYICEIALYHKDFVSTRPSTMAGASLTLARAIVGKQEPSEYGADHHESLVVLALSQHLHNPSSVLARKYASYQNSRVSVKLENFLAQQAEAQRRASPPTPPRESQMLKPVANNNHIYNTPQKAHAHGQMAHGYPTPPITPEGEYFVPGKDHGYQHVAPRCPVTPTPTHNPYTQQQHFQPQYPTYQQTEVMMN